MRASQSDLRKILDNIPDKGQRDIVANILTGQITKVVKCMSKECDGRIIAHIYMNGDIRPTHSDGVMFMRASRNRLDGQIGFQCWCGNDSRLCEAEIGVEGIESGAVQKSDIETVWSRLQGKPAVYPEVAGAKLVDGFSIEDI